MPTIPSLLGSYIDQTYQRLVQVSGSSFADGLGNPITLAPGSVNPTPNYLPFNDAGTFQDSYLNQSSSILKTTSASIDKGLKLDFNNSIFTLGDYNNSNNQFKIIVNDANQLISTTDSNGANGLQVGGGFTNIGAFTGGYTYLGINQGLQTIQTFDTPSTSNGLSLDFINDIYKIGGFNGNNTQIVIDDVAQTITITGSVLLNTITDTPQSNVVTIDTVTGQLYYTASSAFGGGGGSGSVDTSGFVTTSSFNSYTGSTTSRFYGTASYSSTASLAPNYVLNSVTSSFIQNSQTSSFVQNSQTSSFVTTSSFNTFTSSYNTGSFTGSFTGSLQGTASYATTASYVVIALTASYITSSAIVGTVLSASYAKTASYVVTALTASYVTSSNIVGTVTSASYALSSSYALNSTSASFASTASNILGGKATYIPFFKTDTTLATSSIYQSGSTSIIINAAVNTIANPEALYVEQTHPTSFNVISGKGNLNNYLQLNIHNTNAGTSVSSDVVATANNGDENGNYIDMGINGSNFNGIIGNPNDAYLYSTGSDLHIGNATPNKPIQFFAGGFDTNTNRKLQLNPNNSHQMTGSLEISGSLAIRNLTTSNQASVLTYDSTSGQIYYTASSAIGGGTAGVTQILTGSGIIISPTNGIGVVTISSTGGSGGSGFVTTSSFNSYTGSSSSTFAGTADTAATASYSNNFIVASTLTLDATLTDFYAVSPSTDPGINNLFTKNTGSFTSAFSKYTTYSGSNSRAGEFVTSWNGTTVSYYDNSTVDIGNTSAIVFTSAVVSGQIQINTSNTTPSGWQVKILTTFM